MNCSECKDDFAAYIEGLLDPAVESRITSHLADCPACRAEFDEVRRLVVRLTRSGLDVSGISLESQVMDRILQQQALIIRKLQMRKRIRLLGLGGALTAAVILLIVAGIQTTRSDAADAKIEAVKVMAQAADAVPKMSSIHIKGKMRTLPGDNFSYIDAKLDFVPIEMWKQFGKKTKWRVDKPGRVAVMDGKSIMMLIKPDTAIKYPKPFPSAFDTNWLLSLTNVRDLLNEKMKLALAKGWNSKLTKEPDNGEEKLVVTIEAKPLVETDEYMKNKFVDYSDTRLIYRFDAKTKRLEAFSIYLREKDKDVLIFETETIEYNDKLIDPAIFSIKLPEGVSWFNPDDLPKKLPDNEKYEKMTPKETATAFFEACSKEDWDEVQKFLMTPLPGNFKKYLGGIKIIKIGEPFQSKGFPQWFVPYEIKFKDERVQKHNLAIRKDNPAKRFMVDGGI